MLTVAGGFFCWGAVFPIGLLVDRFAPNLTIPQELWNTPKFFVALGMILAVVEDKSELIAGMQQKAAVLNRQLERFSAITSRLLGGGRPDTICPAIAAAITEVSNFSVAVVYLEDAERRMRVAGSSGLSSDVIKETAGTNARLRARSHQELVFPCAAHGEESVPAASAWRRPRLRCGGNRMRAGSAAKNS